MMRVRIGVRVGVMGRLYITCYTNVDDYISEIPERPMIFDCIRGVPQSTSPLRVGMLFSGLPFFASSFMNCSTSSIVFIRQ
jgi:hypothetical protein